MDTNIILSTLKELAYLLGVLGFFIVYTTVLGRQALINLMVGLYVALLISLEFPYYETFLAQANSVQMVAAGKLIIFTIFTILATLLMSRLMPGAFREKKFESFLKKILLSIGATILIMVYSFQVLPVTEFLTPGTPIQSLFAPTQYFFWWLLAPFVVLYLN
jgi:hydrogenase-4 membrane subunit HyfE